MMRILKNPSCTVDDKKITYEILIRYMFALFLQCLIYDSVKTYNALLLELRKPENKLINKDRDIQTIQIIFIKAGFIRADVDNYCDLFNILFTDIHFPLEKRKLKDIVNELYRKMELCHIYSNEDITNIYKLVEKAKKFKFNNIEDILTHTSMSGGSYRCRRKNRNVTKKRTRKNRKSLR
jgi:hypothetical protein